MKSIIYILCIATLTSCGTRKAAIEKDKNHVEVSTDLNSKIEAKITDSIKAEVTETEQKDISSQDTEKTIVREFDISPAGEVYLKKETITDKKLTNSDKSKNDKVVFLDQTHTAEIQIGEIVKYDSIQNTQTKVKTVEANKSVVKNLGGWGVILAIVVLVLVAGWFYLRKIFKV